MSLSLAEIGIGEVVCIEHVGGEPSFRRRLMELGLLPGTRVELLRAAPLGDPLEFRVRGGSLSIRRAEANAVRVVPGASASSRLESPASDAVRRTLRGAM